MRKWRVAVEAHGGALMLKLYEDGEQSNVVHYTCDINNVTLVFDFSGGKGGAIPTLEDRIRIAVQAATHKVRELEREDAAHAEVEVMAARWTKAAQVMFAEGVKEVGGR